MLVNIDPIFGLIDHAKNIQDLTRVLNSDPKYKKVLNFSDFDLKGFYGRTMPPDETSIAPNPVSAGRARDGASP